VREVDKAFFPGVAIIVGLDRLNPAVLVPDLVIVHTVELSDKREVDADPRQTRV
jgi:hypothetical protein